MFLRAAASQERKRGGGRMKSNWLSPEASKKKRGGEGGGRGRGGGGTFPFLRLWWRRKRKRAFLPGNQGCFVVQSTLLNGRGRKQAFFYLSEQKRKASFSSVSPTSAVLRKSFPLSGFDCNGRGNERTALQDSRELKRKREEGSVRICVCLSVRRT